MSSPGREPLLLDPIEQTLFSTAVVALELALKGQLLAFVVADSEGRAWLTPCPGADGAVMDLLGQADWAIMKRITEEFSW